MNETENKRDLNQNEYCFCNDLDYYNCSFGILYRRFQLAELQYNNICMVYYFSANILADEKLR